MQQIARRAAPWKRFPQLLPSPGRGGMRRDVDVEDPAPIVREDDEDEQHTTGNRRHREEIDGYQRAHVVLQERAPRLGGRAVPVRHEPRDCALRDVEAEFPEFAVDAWGAPHGVGRRHLADQAPQFLVHRKPPTGPPRPACPVPCEPTAVPADDRSGTEDHEGRRPVRPNTPEPSPEPPVRAPQGGPGLATLVHGQLLPQCYVLERDRTMPAQEENDQSQCADQLGQHGQA